MGDSWSQVEVAATVADYFSMLESELRGEKYSKTDHRRALLSMLDHRTPAAVEMKHANISAVLLQAGFPIIQGYKPRSNYQQLLRSEVLTQLSQRPTLLEAFAALAQERPPQEMARDSASHLRLIEPPKPSGRAPLKRSIEESATNFRTPPSYTELEARNRILGELGERRVVEFERAHLVRSGRDDLARSVVWTSREEGDGYGYDVRSWFADGRERLIEVKTTNANEWTPFYLTRNEVAVSARYSSAYSLYRLFHFASQPSLFVLDGNLESTCRLDPLVYRARAAG